MFANLSPHLAPLQVVIPLIAAPLSLFLRNATAAWLLALVATWSAFVIACLLLVQVLDQGVLSYALGGWPPPWGIEYRLDAANAPVLVIVSGIGAAVMTYARQGILAEIEKHNQALFFPVFLLALAGLLGVTITGDAFNLFVFLEISSLSTYVLVSLGANRDKRALSAAISYLIAGTIGATFFVIGIGLLYMATGTLNIMDLAMRIADMGDSRLVRAAFAFIIVGIGLKLALFPLHLWLPNAYTFAPSAVTVFIAATSTKVAVYVLMRFVFTVFGTRFDFQELTLSYLFLPLALVGMFVPSIVAVFQTNVKRLLAYSSIAQIGYMLLGLSFATISGLTAASIHLFNHALMKGALFMAVGAVALRMGSTDIDAFTGLGRKMPWTMAAFVAGGLSLIGLPLTVGFVSKWLLIEAAFASGQWWIAGFVVMSSLIAVIYVWRVVELAYLHDTPEHVNVTEAPASVLVPMWGLVLANFYFGINAQFTTSVARRAAEALLGVFP